jgi:hypothetical protein
MKVWLDCLREPTSDTELDLHKTQPDISQV